VETATPLDTVARFSRWLAAVTRRIARKGSRFVVIGGDHSCAIGTWSGVSNAIRHEGALGLIWIDAHLDMHVPETTHSGAINGMPVAALLGFGPPELTGLAEGCPAIDPKNICLLGARSFEPEEIDFSQRYGVRVIAMEEISRRGLEDALAEARAIASDGTAGYGVSLDLDAFDPTDAPGVGTAVPDGIDAGRFLNAWKGLTCASACRGIEIVEYNPFRDRADRTAQLLSNLLTEMVVEETYHG
jgi:arginase